VKQPERSERNQTPGKQTCINRNVKIEMQQPNENAKQTKTTKANRANVGNETANERTTNRERNKSKRNQCAYKRMQTRGTVKQRKRNREKTQTVECNNQHQTETQTSNATETKRKNKQVRNAVRKTDKNVVQRKMKRYNVRRQRGKTVTQTKINVNAKYVKRENGRATMKRP